MSNDSRVWYADTESLVEQSDGKPSTAFRTLSALAKAQTNAIYGKFAESLQLHEHHLSVLKYGTAWRAPAGRLRRLTDFLATEEASLENVFHVPFGVRLAPAARAEAWSNADALRVWIDRLLETGWLPAGVVAGWDLTKAPARFALEAAARQALLEPGELLDFPGATAQNLRLSVFRDEVDHAQGSVTRMPLDKPHFHVRRPFCGPLQVVRSGYYKWNIPEAETVHAPEFPPVRPLL